MADDHHGEMQDQAGFLDTLAPPSPADPAQAAYRVLARKYRPRDFTDLIGQEAMVRTISNAFATGRIPQAWMLTGVRGVGKTTTARILARGLNYQTQDGAGSPTIDLATPGVHCQAIIEGRHIDVLEIDAASNNGVENIRQINDAVRYSPVSARYKVYIIDEVHMLSAGAFNAFLKTLEEPPPHAKFIFATTEIRKVPVTILSRCQRFDLRRIEPGLLVSHLAKICGLEDVKVETEALQAIARAAEGSARDAMSLLDQAIAHAAGEVRLEDVRDMLGLSDRARIIDLFEMVMRGDAGAALGELRAQYDIGADPAVVLSDLAEFTHLVTRLKVAPEAAKDGALSPAERQRGAEFAGKLSVRLLSRAWQMLLKGIAELRDANRPLAAAEMVLVRLCHAADLPTPDEALRLLRDLPAPGPDAARGASPTAPAGSGPRGALASVSGAGGGGQQARPALSRPAPQPQPAAPLIASLQDIAALAGRNRDIRLQAMLMRDVRPVSFAQGRIEIALEPGADRAVVQELSRKLKEWTGENWFISLSQGQGGETLRERHDAAERERKDNAAGHPAVRAVLASFPGAKIVDVRVKGAEEADPGPTGDDAGLAASLESGDGLIDSGEPDEDIDF